MSGTETTPSVALNRARITLLVVAIIEFLSSLSNIAVLLSADAGIPGTTPGGLLVMGAIVLIPFVALAATVLAARRRIPQAIIALACVVLLAWLSYLPSVIGHWGDLPSASLMGAIAAARFIAFPILAGLAMFFAIRNERLGLASTLVTLPTLLDILGVIAFGVGVAVHGF